MSTASSPVSGEPGPCTDDVEMIDTAPAHLAVRQRKYIGALEVAKFMEDVKHPVTLTEPLVVIRKQNPVGVSLPRCKSDSNLPSVQKPVNNHVYLLYPLSERTSEYSLRLLLEPLELKVFVPKIKLLVLNENAKGKFSRIFRLNVPMVLRTFALVQATGQKRTAPEFLCAYGIKSFFHPLSDNSAENPQIHLELCKMIHNHFKNHWLESVSSPELLTKFGGGLARKTASTASNHTNARFCIRGPTDDLKCVSDDEWKRRGAVSFENESGGMTIVRFVRIEQRDYACDSFILGFDLSGIEIGLSQIRTPKGLVLVSIENGSNDLKPIDVKNLISPSQTTIMPPPLPSPRPR